MDDNLQRFWKTEVQSLNKKIEQRVQPVRINNRAEYIPKIVV